MGGEAQQIEEEKEFKTPSHILLEKEEVSNTELSKQTETPKFEENSLQSPHF